MKVTLIANIYANGKVLLAENSSYQAPQEAIIEFMSIATKAGNYVMGRKTFEMLEGAFVNIKAAFQGIELVILSEGGSISKEFKVVAHPNEAMKHLSEKGFEEIIIGGGTATYNLFLEGKWVTDIYFNIHPVIIGNGGILATDHKLISNFKLVGHKQVTENILQLHLTKM